MFLLGPTGTGKSTMIIGILQQLLGDGVPFMGFDFKRNYRCLLSASSKVLVVTVGRNLAPVGLNVMQPPEHVEFNEWAEALADIMSSSYLLMQGARNVLKAALITAHELYGQDARRRDALALIRTEMGKARPGSRRYGWLESSARTLEELTNGEFGTALNAKHATPVWPPR
jgi:hypothetical protein